VTGGAWVIGRGGLLGSHVERALVAGGSRPFVPDGPRRPWIDEPAIQAALAASAAAFLRTAAADAAPSWSVFWCAGAGVVATPPSELEGETRTFERFLAALGDALAASPARARPGLIFLASSAGTVYGARPSLPITERSPTSAASSYGRAKLAQETALARFIGERPNVSGLVGRISNLYGPGQNMGKPQGLISHMSQSIIHRYPIHIYVPLDTVRDYVFAGDAASAIVRWMARRIRDPRPLVMKLCAAEQGTTIAALVNVMRQIARRRVKVVSALRPATGGQAPALQFRSVEWVDEPTGATTTLLAGIGQVYRDHLRLHREGKLPAPDPSRR
jgi:UDP-glucose 4-epimerase